MLTFLLKLSLILFLFYLGLRTLKRKLFQMLFKQFSDPHNFSPPRSSNSTSSSSSTIIIDICPKCGNLEGNRHRCS